METESKLSIIYNKKIDVDGQVFTKEQFARRDPHCFARYSLDGIQYTIFDNCQNDKNCMIVGKIGFEKDNKNYLLNIFPNVLSEFSYINFKSKNSKLSQEDKIEYKKTLSKFLSKTINSLDDHSEIFKKFIKDEYQKI